MEVSYSLDAHASRLLIVSITLESVDIMQLTRSAKCTNNE